MVDVEIQVPISMKPYIQTEDPYLALRRNALMLYSYIQDQIISHGKAAEILGIKKWDLIEMYADVGIPYFDMDIQEVEEVLETIRTLNELKV
jgi:hypothetical protein